MSPLLFNLFISDLAKKFDTMEGKLQLGSISLNSLFWADDLVLFAETKEDLDRLLKTLEEFCKENELIINTKKTKCMIFNKTGRLMRRPFFLDGVKLEMVRSYKYLGFVITPSGEISTGLKDLRDRAFKGFMKMKNDLGLSFNQDVCMTLTLIDSLIKPILLYASDFWGSLKLPLNNPIENLHMMMLKQLLGVQKQTSNIGVLLELGRTPLKLSAIKFAIKNWERIRMGKGDDRLIGSYRDDDISWDANIKTLLELNGTQNFYENEPDSEYPFIYKKLFQKLSDDFHRTSFDTIKGEQCKLRTYSCFKTEIGFEKYLIEVKNTSDRIAVTKFRLSNHKLMIEVGRYEDTPREERFCPFCPQVIENESHFMLICPIYSGLRTRYLSTITTSIQNFQFLPHDAKLQILFTNTEQGVAKYIATSMELRQLLVSKPRVFS